MSTFHAPLSRRACAAAAVAALLATEAHVVLPDGTEHAAYRDSDRTAPASPR